MHNNHAHSSQIMDAEFTRSNVGTASGLDLSSLNQGFNFGKVAVRGSLLHRRKDD